MCQIWLRSDRRECNAGMKIAKCTKNAASSNVSNHLSRTPAAWCASGAAHHARPYRNLGRRISLRSYTIVETVSNVRRGRACTLQSRVVVPSITGAFTKGNAKGLKPSAIFPAVSYWMGTYPVCDRIRCGRRHDVRACHGRRMYTVRIPARQHQCHKDVNESIIRRRIVLQRVSLRRSEMPHEQLHRATCRPQPWTHSVMTPKRSLRTGSSYCPIASIDII